MRIQVNISALKESRWYQLAVRFALGGLITVAAGLIAKRYGPSVGGLFLAFPAIFPAGATLIEKHERERKEKLGLNGKVRGRKAASVDAAGAAMGSIGLLVFAFLISRFLADYSPWLVMVGATLAWMAVSVFLWHIRKHEWRMIRMPHARGENAERANLRR
jgi:hypothetical protein